MRCGCECKMMRVLWKSMKFLKKLKTELSYDPGIPPLCMHLQELKAVSQKGCLHTQTHTNIHSS